MKLYAGIWDPAWGHTWVTRGFGKLYALKSLENGSSLCIADDTAYGGLVICRPGESQWKSYPTPGAHSCHITLLGKEAVVSDYTSGTLSIYPLDEDGTPCKEPDVLQFTGRGPHPKRQTSSHIHSTCLSADGTALVAVDLGADRIYRFAILEGRLQKESVEIFQMPAGCGPRHCICGNDALYLATELSDELLVFDWPSMVLRQRLVVNPALPGGGGHIIKTGDYIYVSSRLDNDGIGIFRTGPNGWLDKIAYCQTGVHPRQFCLSPDKQQLLVACRDSNVIQVFDRNPETGALKPSGIEYAIPHPVYVEAV